MDTRKLIFCVLTTLAHTFAHPKCEFNKNDVTHIVCTPGESDYVLDGGLVSDNNHTTKITLRGCRIAALGHEAFRGLPLLKHIDLSNNNIREPSFDTLEDAGRLNHLNLSYNGILSIPDNLFENMTRLLSLDLKGNQINNLNLLVFNTMRRLKYLDLSNNYLLGNRLSSDIFNLNPNINFMDFSGNDMSDTTVFLFDKFQSLEVLNLERCMLTDVPKFAVAMNLRTMKKLSLSMNQIIEISDKTFIYLTSLEQLDISQNFLESVHEDIFKPLRNLRIIVLRNNKLQQIPDTLFLNMRLLSNIDLSNNFITFIPVNAFRGTGLRNLNLSNNKFTYLTDNFCLELRNTGVMLQKFYFNQNPWQCRCLLDIVKEVEKFGIAYNTVKYDGKQAVCVTDDFTCKRHDNFNEIYVDLYNSLVLKN